VSTKVGNEIWVVKERGHTLVESVHMYVGVARSASPSWLLFVVVIVSPDWKTFIPVIVIVVGVGCAEVIQSDRMMFENETVLARVDKA
jgi:hypothetical protein